jgi:hypothetical protein
VGKPRLGAISAGPRAVASYLPNFARRDQEVDLVAVACKGAERLERIRST